MGKPIIEGKNVSIGNNCQFGRDVLLGENVTLGDNLRIGDNVRIDFSSLGDGVTVERGAYIGYSTLTGWFSMPTTEDYSAIELAKIGAGTLIRTGTTIYKGAEIGQECWVNHNALIREKSIIGNHTSIGSGADLEGFLTVGHYSSLHSQTHIGAKTTIGDYVFMAPFSVTTNDNPMGYRRNLPTEEMGPTIGFGACIAVHVTILPRVRVGAETIIGAQALVSRDVPDGKIAMGVPAKIVGDVPDNLHLPDEIRRRYGRL